MDETTFEIPRPDKFDNDKAWAYDLTEQVWILTERLNLAESYIDDIQQALAGWASWEPQERLTPTEAEDIAETLRLRATASAEEQA